MDLDEPPPVLLCPVQAGGDASLGIRGRHHIVPDAAGAALVARRVAEIYTALTAAQRTASENGGTAGGNDSTGDGRSRPEPDPNRRRGLPESPFGSLRLLLDRDEEYRSSEEFAKDRAYWTEHFADSPEPARLSDRPGDGLAGVHARDRLLTEEEAVELRAAARKSGTHWSAMMIAATAAYLTE